MHTEGWVLRMEIHAEAVGMHSRIGGTAFYIFPPLQDRFHCILHHFLLPDNALACT